MGEAKRRRETGADGGEPLDQLDKLLALGEQHVRRILLERRDPEVSAFYHLVGEDGQNAIVSCLGQKDLVLATVKAQARKMNAVAAMHVGEGWMIAAPKMTPWHRDRWLATHPPPSESPDRVEVVQIVVTDGEDHRGRLFQMIRDKPGGRIMSLVPCTDGDVKMQGRLVDGIIPRRA